MMPTIFISVFIGILVFFISLLNFKISGMDEATAKTAKSYNTLLNVRELIYDFFSTERGFDELIAGLEDYSSTSSFKKEIGLLQDSLDQVHGLIIHNDELFEEMSHLLSQAGKNASEYISLTSQRLASPQERYKVTTIERAVIGGAKAALEQQYQFQLLLKSYKTDLSYKDQLLEVVSASLDQVA